MSSIGPNEGTLRFAEKLLGLLDGTKTTATYKYAVLLGLMDLCLEHTSKHAEAPTVLTTRQLAEKVIEFYWPHTVAHHACRETLKQNSSGQAEIVSAVRKFRERSDGDSGASLWHLARTTNTAYERLVRRVEFKLVEMPLPRLQFVGNKVDAFIYKIWWQPKALRITKISEMDPYERFDNRIHLVDGAGEHLVRLSGLLRPIIQSQWTRLVARFNKFEEAELEDFLFGADRVSTAPVRAGLVEIQNRRCFYCDARMAKVEIDHFVPWARYADNSLSNLVAACSTCNARKSAYLAAASHVERWAVRLHSDATGHDIESLAAMHDWPYDASKTLNVARGIYCRLPHDAKLWYRNDEFADADLALLNAVLAA